MRALPPNRQATEAPMRGEGQTLVQQCHSPNLRLIDLVGTPPHRYSRYPTDRESLAESLCMPARLKIIIAIAALAVAAGCTPRGESLLNNQPPPPPPQRETIWDLFSGGNNPNTTIAVNRYLWNATFDILGFLPVESSDPFSGVVVFGYGTPPGSGRAYRATVHVRDPALDARSLVVSVQTRGGPASLQTQRAIEDAILTRARQLRVQDGQF